MNAAVVGPGAIGCTCGAALAGTGRVELVLCGRRAPVATRVSVGERPPVELTAQVATEPDGLEPADWLLLSVKAHQTDGAASWLHRLAGEGTTVVVLQNGVRRDEAVRRHTGDAAVVPAVVWIGAAIEGGVVRVATTPAPLLRVPDDGPGRAFAELLTGSWLAVEPTADLELDAWRKLTLNAVVGLMALTGRRAGMFRRADMLELARAYARECAAVARAEGVPLGETEAEQLAEQLAAAPEGMPTSILVDRERGLPLEWRARNGVVRELGALRGVATPVSDVVVPLLAAASGEEAA